MDKPIRAKKKRNTMTNQQQTSPLRREAIALLEEHNGNALAAIEDALKIRNEAIEYAQGLLLSSSKLVDSLEQLVGEI